MASSTTADSGSDQHRGPSDCKNLYREDGRTPRRAIEPSDEFRGDDRQDRQKWEEDKRDRLDHPLAEVVDLLGAGGARENRKADRVDHLAGLGLVLDAQRVRTKIVAGLESPKASADQDVVAVLEADDAGCRRRSLNPGPRRRSRAALIGNSGGRAAPRCTRGRSRRGSRLSCRSPLPPRSCRRQPGLSAVAEPTTVMVKSMMLKRRNWRRRLIIAKGTVFTELRKHAGIIRVTRNAVRSPKIGVTIQ